MLSFRTVRLPLRLLHFKAAMFALLAANTAYYLFTDTWSRGLDALAWFALLALFELETGGHLALQRDRVFGLIRIMRLAAAAAVCVAAVGYLYQEETLDAINAWLWIGVVVLLESEVRFPDAVREHRAWFAIAATLIYSGLAVLVPVWAWRGEWFDAYDALLWLVAFATLEMDVLKSRKQ